MNPVPDAGPLPFPHPAPFPFPHSAPCTLPQDKAGGQMAARFVFSASSYPLNKNRNATSVAPAISSGPVNSFRKIAWSYLRCM